MRIGMDGYAAILASLHAGPKSTTQLAEEHQVSRLLVLGMMRHCLRAKVVHRPEWYCPMPHARMVPLWALGEQGDVSMPQFEEQTRRPRRGPSTLILLTTAIEMLKDRPYTRAELAEDLKMHIETACRVVDALRKARLCFVESWNVQPRGTSVAEFRYGTRSDKPRPGRRPAQQEWKKYRVRRSQMRVMHALAGAQHIVPRKVVALGGAA